MEIRYAEYPTARKAVEAKGDREALYMDGQFLVVDREDADRLAATGDEFAYLCSDRAGRIYTVPVN